VLPECRFSVSNTREIYVDHILRFRWVSMQLQYLCLVTLDADIQNNLGRLPPDLRTLYNDIYEMLSTKPGELRATVFKNVLYWLLCAQRTLRTDEFLAAVSIDLERESDVDLISKDLVLEICSNFVIFDSQLNTFRFAHLSVREFLESRPEYNKSVTNSLIAEVCLWAVMSTSRSLATEKLFLQLGWYAKAAPAIFENLRKYADIYWAVHCKLAGNERKSGPLKIALKHILSDNDDETTSSLILWTNRLQPYFKEYIGWGVHDQLQDAVSTTNLPSSAGLFVSCAFDFEEQIEDILDRKLPTTPYMNSQGRSPLHVAVRNSSYATLALLIAQDEFGTELTAEVVKAAAGNSYNGKEMMTLLLDQRGADVQITEEVVKAAAGNKYNGKEVMTLLLDQRRADVQITEEVVKAAAGNKYNGKEVMTLLLYRQGADVQITEEVVATIVGQFDKDVVALLLDQQGADVQITEEVVKAAAGNYHNDKEVMTLLLNQPHLVRLEQQLLITVEEHVIEDTTDTSRQDDAFLRTLTTSPHQPTSGIINSDSPVWPTALSLFALALAKVKLHLRPGVKSGHQRLEWTCVSSMFALCQSRYTSANNFFQHV
jgi:hypothetical protein